MPKSNTKKRSRCPNGERKNPKTGKCEKKTTVSKKTTKKKKVKTFNNKTAGPKRNNKINKLYNLKYLMHLLEQKYFNDISTKLYSRDYKRKDFIPLSEITLVVQEDMELQYDGDRTVGTQGHPQRLFPDDSGNWYVDSKKLKENDVVYDESESAESRTDVEAWLVVKRGGKLGLIMFPMDDGSHFDQGFSDGDTVSIDGKMINPVTGNLVQVF